MFVQRVDFCWLNNGTVYALFVPRQGYRGLGMTISAIQQAYAAHYSSGAAKTAADGNAVPATDAQKSTTEEVQLSAQGRLLSQLPELILPTLENIQTLSDSLSKDLNKLFSDAGIATTPAVEFEVNPYNAEITVKGEREDKQQITELLEQNPQIERQIRDIAAISSHYEGMSRAMEADRAYRAANNPAEVNQVIAKYASIYSGHQPVAHYSLLFDDSGVNVRSDGKPLMSSSS
jgi:hypothetical protein